MKINPLLSVKKNTWAASKENGLSEFSAKQLINIRNYSLLYGQSRINSRLRQGKALIILRERTGWSEASLAKCVLKYISRGISINPHWVGHERTWLESCSYYADNFLIYVISTVREALIKLHWCASWSEPLLCGYPFTHIRNIIPNSEGFWTIHFS